MRIGKKLVFVVVLSLLLLFSTTAIPIKIRHNKEINNENDCTNSNKQEICDNVIIIDGNPVLKSFPPIKAEHLAMMDQNPQPKIAAGDLPSQFSWKNYGGDWTTGTRDQASCGSCWAFSALAAIEASINIASGNPSTDIDLSEQYVLSCLSGAGSCSGGWMHEAIDYIQSTASGSYGNGINGCPIESCMPYQAVDYIPCDNKCDDWDYYTNPPEINNKLFQILNWGWTTTSEDSPSDWAMIKSWLITYGPLSIDILATGFGSWGNSHHSPTDVYQNDDYGTTNHGVLLVGWVDDDQILNGGYWIIKNSWGAGWGYGGFGNIAYGCNGVATRNCVWVTTTSWPQGGDNGGGPVDVDVSVFANFDFQTDDGHRYPHLGDEVEFIDSSDGNVGTYEWDLNGDGVIDSTRRRPTWTYTQEGDYEVTLTVRNSWGPESSRTRTVSVREIWPPVVDIRPLEYPDPDHPDNDLEVQFDGRYSYDPDEGMITNYHWDFGDGTTSDEPNPLHTFPEADRIYEVILTLTDSDGGTSSATREIKIDQTVPPITTIYHGFGDDGTDWYKETERISFSATDWTKVISTYFRIDGGSWQLYVASEQEYHPVGSEGMHTVEAYSVDYYRNEETPVSDTFGIDKSDPTVDITITGTKNGEYYIGPVTVTLSGSDSLSGIDSLFYNLGGAGLIEYTGPFTIDKTAYLQFMAKDKAGNIQIKDVDINFEPAPSSPKISGQSKGEPGKVYEFSFSSTDYFPEGDQIYYFVEWGDGTDSGWQGPYNNGEELTLSHMWTQSDSYIIKAKAKDSFDAESDWSTLSISMPKSKSSFFINRLISRLNLDHLLNYILNFRLLDII